MDQIPPSFDYCPILTSLKDDETKFTPFTGTLSTSEPFALVEKIAFKFSFPAHGRGTPKIQHLNEANTAFTPFTPHAIFE